MRKFIIFNPKIIMDDWGNVLKFGKDRSSAAEYKNNLLKKAILSYLTTHEEATIADLSNELTWSVPTVTKLIQELKEEGYLTDLGKLETAGGRRPNVFGLAADAFYFLGVDIRRRRLEFVLLDFKGYILHKKQEVPFVLENTPEALELVCQETEKFISEIGMNRKEIIGIGFSLTGRVDSNSGYSYTYFNFNEIPLTEVLQQRLGIRAYIENDSRAMMYAEKTAGVVKEEKNVIFLNIGRGVGVGILIDNKLYSGKTGFAGEFGHIPLFPNEILCSCGKKGCLETEASGLALEKMFVEHMKAGEISVLSKQWKKGKEILLYDIIQAAHNDDMLAISLISEIAEKLGRGVGILINLLNPELIVIGGTLSLVGDYLMLPLKTAINKYALSLISKDTCFKISKLGDNASVLGVAMLIRAKIMNIL